MRRISSQWTWWHKKAFPVIWFGFLGLISLGWSLGVIRQQVPIPTLLFPLGMAAFGYILMRRLVFPLADEVWIDRDDIIVRKNGQEERFPIANIINVDSSHFSNPERLTLTLKDACAFGHEIAFAPPWRLFHITRHPLAQELIHRIHGKEENDGASFR